MVSNGQYVIGPRDVLEIYVMRCPEFDSLVTVRALDGGITIPLAGDMKACGLTPKELANEISKKLAYYVKEPKVAVGVKAFGDKKVLVLGQVRGPGSYMVRREDRIIDAIMKSGGFNDNAVPSLTYIVRGGYDDPQIVKVNMARLIHKGDTTQNVYIAEGDIVYVPMSELENINYALRKIFPSMYFAEQLATIESDIMAQQFDWHEVWNKMAGVSDRTRR